MTLIASRLATTTTPRRPCLLRRRTIYTAYRRATLYRKSALRYSAVTVCRHAEMITSGTIYATLATAILMTREQNVTLLYLYRRATNIEITLLFRAYAVTNYTAHRVEYAWAIPPLI